MRNLNFLFSNSVQGESDLTRYCPRDAFEMPLTCPRHLFCKMLILSMLLMVIGVGNVWGAETLKTTCVGTGSGYGTRRTATYNSIGWVLSTGQSGYLGTNSAENHALVKPTAADLPVVKAQNGSASTTTTGYYFYYTSTAISNVTKIEFYLKGKKGSSTANAYVVSCSTAASSGSTTWSKPTLASGTGLSAQGANVASAGTYTFKLNSKETSAKYYGIVIYTGSYFRIDEGSIKIYIDDAPAYTVTASSNNNSYGTVSVSGTTITATPADCYQVVNGTGGYTVNSGTYSAITHTGTSNTISVTPTSNCDITVNFEKKTVNTYVDEIQGNDDIEDCGTHSAPALDDKAYATSGTCAQQHWHFAGWTSAAYKASPEGHIITAGTSMTANGTTYYAVWSKGVTSTFDGTTEGKYKIYATVSSTNYYATNTVSSSTLQATTTVGSAQEFDFTKSGDYWTISYTSGVNTYYLTAPSNNSVNVNSFSTTSCTWKIATGTYGSWRLWSRTPNGSGTNAYAYRALMYSSGTGFKNYTISSSNYDCEISSTEYSDYICTCCTELGSINGSISLSKGKSLFRTFI